MYKDRNEMLEDVLMLTGAPDGDNEIVAYFATSAMYPGVDLVDFGDQFVAIHGKRRGTGATPAEAIRACLTGPAPE